MPGMPDWEEWSEHLTEEQRKYSLYKILSDLYRRECVRDCTCKAQLMECKNRFDKLDKRKWFDKGIAVICGLISGIAGALGIKIGG